jgi:hypothetical protein
MAWIDYIMGLDKIARDEFNKLIEIIASKINKI